MDTHENNDFERIKVNHGVMLMSNNGCSYDYANCSSSSRSISQPESSWRNGVGSDQMQSQKSNKISSCILSRFESPTSAFYATERYMSGFYESSVDQNQSYEVNFRTDDQSNSELKNTLLSVVQPHLLSTNQYHNFSDKSVYINPSSDDRVNLTDANSVPAARISDSFQEIVSDKVIEFS